VYGGVKKKSNITNAKAHQGDKHLFGTEFYPNIKASQVYSSLMGHGYSSHLAHWLTRLTTTDDEVPQGAPTSTSISNLVFYQTDARLAAFCKEHTITYTRYIDYLAFSS
jgi:RNA-directed DNA polymerase